MAFVFSPSNLMTYRQCPRKFWGQSISKLITHKPTKRKTRGILLHGQIQDALRDPAKFDKIQQDTQVDIQYVERLVDGIQDQRMLGYQLYIEHELCMNKAGQQVGWRDDKAFLRAKADVFLLHPDKRMPMIVVDIKTGRSWDKLHVQLRVEALLAHIIYCRPFVRYEYWYVDQGETEDDAINFSRGIYPVLDIYNTMREMGQAIKNNYFPATQNSLCKWCDFNNTENCDDR